MAFKAVQGVSPSAAESLDVLWGSTGFENEDDSTAKTVTKSPNKRVKEKIIEDWDDWVFLEWVSYLKYDERFVLIKIITTQLNSNSNFSSSTP